MASEYVGKWNKYQQCIIVRADEAHLPFVNVSWYDGGIHIGGHAAVLPGETDEQAARRVFGSRVPACYADTFRFFREELSDECPARAARFA